MKSYRTTPAGKQIVFELNDQQFRLSGRELKPVGSVSELVGDKWIVSDFDGVRPQVMTVDAPIKYADAVIERRLREQGSLMGGGKILVLRKQRRGSRATECLFVNVSPALYTSHTVAADDDPSHQSLFALHSLLARELENLRPSKPVALLLVHDRHVDAVVGCSKRTYGAFRASRQSADESFARLGENLSDGLRRVEQEHNIRIKEIRAHHWLLEQPEDGEWTRRLAGDLGIPCIEPELSTLTREGRQYVSSIPSLLAKLSIADSVSTPTQKHLFRAKTFMPWAAAALVSMVLLTLPATFFWQQQTRNLQAESALIQDSLSPPEPGPAVLQAAYEKPLQLADTLGRAQIAPSFHSVLSEVSASVSSYITFNQVLIEYPDDEPKVTLILIGQSEEVDEGEGVPTFNTFLASLRQRGFQLVNSELKTQSDTFSFLVELERGLK